MLILQGKMHPLLGFREQVIGVDYGNSTLNTQVTFSLKFNTYKVFLGIQQK